MVVAPVLGPTLGGWLTDAYSWRWAFYINIPIGILAMFMIMRYVQDPIYIREAQARALRRNRLWPAGDLAGRAADHARQGAGRRLVRRHLDSLGGRHPRRLLSSLSSYGNCGARNPLVNLRVFLNRNFALGCMLIGLFGGVIYG